MKLFDFLFGKRDEQQKTEKGNSFIEQTKKEPQTVPDNSTEQWRSYFDEIFTGEFSEFTIEKNVSATELVDITGARVDVHPACTPVDFLFIKDNQPILAVVLVRANTYRGMNVIGTRNICDAAELEYVRFFMDMPNERDYVVDRLKGYLN